METMVGEGRIPLSKMGETRACPWAEGQSPWRGQRSGENGDNRQNWSKKRPEGWCSGWAVRRNQGQLSLLGPQDDQAHWDRQSHCKPIWCLLRTRKSCPFSIAKKRKARDLALQVKTRQNFNSQSPPRPHAFVQCTHAAARRRVQRDQVRATCVVGQGGPVPGGGSGCIQQSYNAFYSLFPFVVYTPRKNSFLTKQTKWNPSVIDSEMPGVALFILIKTKHKTQPKYAPKGRQRSS